MKEVKNMRILKITLCITIMAVIMNRVTNKNNVKKLYLDGEKIAGNLTCPAVR